MAQFRGTLKGGRGAVSRLGHKTSGLTVSANGWTAGVRVCAAHVDGRDEFRIYRTAGSGYALSDQYLGTVNGAGDFIPAGKAVAHATNK